MTESEPRPRRIHMIGNAHLDPVWLWGWDEGWQEAAATFESALRLLDEHPDFVVTRGESALYEWLEESHPHLIARVREHVRAGRWELVGGWVVQSDTNLPCGEALIRQALLGKRYFRQTIGVEVEVGYCVDSFGHAATLPQLLAGCGYRAFVFMRPMKHEKAMPSNLFRWRGPDGAEVLAFRIPVAYQTTDVSVPDHLAKVLAELPAEVDAGMCFYGVGDHGGGPTREQIEAIRALQRKGPHTLLFSRCDAFFREVEPLRDRLPVVCDELQNHAIGCYSAVRRLKQLNRRTESALIDAEALSALAWRLQGGYFVQAPPDINPVHPVRSVHPVHSIPDDRPALRAAWKTLLFNQFHDVLPGSSIRRACDDAMEQLGGARQQALHVAWRAIRRIARRVEVRPPAGAKWQQSLVIFNPTGVERREIVRWTPWLRWRLDWKEPEKVALADGEGNRLPAQLVFSEKAVGRKALPDAFALAVSVPPFGFAVYHLLEEEWRGDIANAARAEGLTLSNGLIRATIDPRSGGLASLKGADGEELLAASARHVIVDDPSDTWAHGVARFGEAEAAFEAVGEPVVVYQGPLAAEIRTESVWRDCRLVQEFRLDAGAPHLEVRCYLDWRGARKLLRFEFPLRRHGDATAEVPHGFFSRPPDGREYPMLRWVALGGVTVANDSAYSYRATHRALGITVLRSPFHAHHDPHVPDPVRRMDVSDQGEHRYALRLLPCDGECEPAAYDLADAQNRPLLLTSETFHEGDLGTRASLLPLAVLGGARAVALKRAEEPDRLVLRALDVSGRGGRLLTAKGDVLRPLRPRELVTLSLDPADPARGPVVLDHIERFASRA